jgi:hypothetical protein
VLYTGKCHKGDEKLTWNKFGPQGPGATTLIFNGSGTASPTPTALGKMGAYTLKASCVQPSAGDTIANLLVTGPAGEIDGMSSGASGGNETPDDEQFPALTDLPLYSGIGSTGGESQAVGDWLWIPSSGPGAQALITIISIGGSTNTCHISIAVTPTSAP